MKNIFFLIILAGAAYGIYQAYLSSQTETKEARSIKSLPPSVQHAVAGMDPTTQSAFFNEYEAKKKRSSIGYIALPLPKEGWAPVRLLVYGWRIRGLVVFRFVSDAVNRAIRQ
jgi:hypothetical protein